MASIAGKLSSIKLKPIGTKLEKRLGGSGPATQNPTKPTPTATPEPEELTAGSPEEAT